MNARRASTAPARSDAELLARIAEGDLTALGELYDRYHADVRRVVGRVARYGPDVDDVVQATFLALPKIAASFDGRASARGWLGGVAVRLEARRRRSVARLLRTLTSFGSVSRTAHETTPEDSAVDRDDMRAMERGLARMAAGKRDVFVLVELEGLSLEDVAHALDVHPATVRTRLFHARRELRDALTRRGHS